MIEIYDDNGDKLLSVAGESLVGQNLANAYLRGAQLAGMDLSGANLRDANLNEANLQNASLAQADLTGTNLRKANLVSANLSHAAFGDGTDLSNAKFHGAVLDGTWLSSQHFPDGTDVEWQDVSFVGACLVGLSFRQLRGANFSNARIQYCNLSGADLRDTDFTGSKIEYTLLKRARFNDRTRGLNPLRFIQVTPGLLVAALLGFLLGWQMWNVGWMGAGFLLALPLTTLGQLVQLRYFPD